MLQYIVEHTNSFSAPELAQMAIEGGCRWIQLSPRLCVGSPEAMRELAAEIIPLCQEEDTFLVIENDVELVADLKVHGVVLRDASPQGAAAAREQLGAHAVIGVYTRSLSEIMVLKGLDIDYIIVPEPTDPQVNTIEFYTDIADQMKAQAIDIHLVAQSNAPAADLARLLNAGCAGVAVSSAISDAADPVEATSAIITALNQE